MVATIVLGGWGGAGAHGTQGARVDPAILAAFDSLALSIDSLAAGVLPPGQRIGLLGTVRNAEGAYRRHHPCVAAHVLRAYLDETQALRRGRRQGVAEELYNQGRRLRDDVVAAVPAGHPCHDPRATLADADVRLRTSDNRGLAALVTFGRPRLETRQVGGEVWTAVEVPGLRVGMDGGGTPGVPAFRRLIGVPRDAQPEITAIRPQVAETIRLNLFPFQAVRHQADLAVDDFQDSIPPPSLYVDGPFEKDDGAYARRGPFPAPICRVRLVGSARDLSMAVVECAAAQYDAVTGALTLFETVEFDVAFRGGTGNFLTAASLSPFEPAMGSIQGAVLNRVAVGRYVEADPRTFRCLGEELLILTHPDFREAAETLAAWKRNKGILTSVFEVNDDKGPGPDTNEEIDAFIEERYDTCLVRPSYIALLGDADKVPTFHLSRLLTTGERNLATDHPYACRPGPCARPFTVVPSFAVGRLSVGTAASAETVVSKIIRYETAPLDDPAFYQNASMVGYFECCRVPSAVDPGDVVTIPGPDGREDIRSFVETAELLRGQLTSRGYAVSRLYATGPENHPEYQGDPTPRYFASGTSLPSPLRPQDGFAWDANAQRIVQAFEDGRFLVVYVGHGSAVGWVKPTFVPGSGPFNTGPLQNGERLPVVFSMGCSTGSFDTTPSALAERLVDNPDGGAIGVFAFTRVAEATSFRPFLLGALDSVWPEILPSFGADLPRRRLGDILISSKLWFLTSAAIVDPPPSFEYVADHVRMFHLFGDPTLAMWTATPRRLPGRAEVRVGPEGPEIFYAVDGAVITGVQETAEGPRPVGRAVVENGVARLTFQPLLPGVPLGLSASQANAISTPLETSIQP